MAEDEGFVSRWSRLKTAARHERREEPPGDADRQALDVVANEPEAVVPAPQPTGDELPDETDEAALAPSGEDARAEAGATPRRVAIADLPDIDSLRLESDFTVFLQDGVPDSLRNAALRRLWRLDPVFANLDGLVDYGGDYTDAALAVENLKTSYRFDLGFLDGGDERSAAADILEERTPDAHAVGSVKRPPAVPSETSPETSPADRIDAPRAEAARADDQVALDRPAGVRETKPPEGGGDRDEDDAAQS